MMLFEAQDKGRRMMARLEQDEREAREKIETERKSKEERKQEKERRARKFVVKSQLNRAMLPKELGGAVDEVLGDYDVDGFRVVDASAAPMLLGANTCQAVYAIPEKARDPD